MRSDRVIDGVVVSIQGFYYTLLTSESRATSSFSCDTSKLLATRTLNASASTVSAVYTAMQIHFGLGAENRQIRARPMVPAGELKVADAR
jgi:hypothetical protein